MLLELLKLYVFSTMLLSFSGDNKRLCFKRRENKLALWLTGQSHQGNSFCWPVPPGREKKANHTPLKLVQAKLWQFTCLNVFTTTRRNQ